MNRLRSCGRAAAVLVACGALLGLGLLLTDQAVAQKKEPGLANTGEPAKKPRFSYSEKRFTLEFRDKPWKSVFEWLTDKTGVVCSFGTIQPPTGSFSLVVPRDRKYSMAEIIDIINEGLLQHKYLLLRRPARSRWWRPTRRSTRFCWSISRWPNSPSAAIRNWSRSR